MSILLRVFLRRDRWMILWWALGIALLYYAQAPSVDGLYATQAEFDKAAAAMASNQAFIAMAGPARALNTVGGQVAWQASAFGAVLAGLMSMFLLGRHTRVEEETGREELIRSTALSRRTPLNAAIAVTLAANAVVGIAVTASLLSYGLDAAGCVALGVQVALTGWVFTGTAAIAAQLTTSARSMYAISGAVIGLAYALRAVGDVGNGTLSWLSPIGWGQALRAFSGERWWPALLLLAGCAATLGTAYAVFGRRDLGAGVLPDRPGPARAPATLVTPIGLAWRLQRGSVLGWTLGLLLGGLAYGSIGDQVGELIGDSKLSRDVFAQGGSDLVQGFYASAIVMLALMAGGFATSSALRPHGEESDQRLEALLATGLSRTRWLAGHLAVTAGGTVLTVTAAGLGLGLGYALVTGDSAAIGRLLVAAVPYAAPVLVLVAVSILIYAIAPRWTVLAWLGLAGCVVVMFFGPLLGLPGWVQDISPFHHLALAPAESFRAAPVLVSLAVAFGGSWAGVLLFGRRDVS